MYDKRSRTKIRFILFVCLFVLLVKVYFRCHSSDFYFILKIFSISCIDSAWLELSVAIAHLVFLFQVAKSQVIIFCLLISMKENLYWLITIVGEDLLSHCVGQTLIPTMGYNSSSDIVGEYRSPVVSNYPLQFPSDTWKKFCGQHTILQLEFPKSSNVSIPTVPPSF